MKNEPFHGVVRFSLVKMILLKLYVVPLQKVRPDWPVIEISGAGHMNAMIKPQFADALIKRLEKFCLINVSAVTFKK